MRDTTKLIALAAIGVAVWYFVGKTKPQGQAGQGGGGRQSAGSIFDAITPGVPSGGGGGTVAVPRPGANAGTSVGSTNIGGGASFGPGGAGFGPGGGGSPARDSGNGWGSDSYGPMGPIRRPQPQLPTVNNPTMDYSRPGEYWRQNQNTPPSHNNGGGETGRTVYQSDMPEGKNGRPLEANEKDKADFGFMLKMR